MESFDWSLVKPENRLWLFAGLKSQTTMDRHFPAQYARQSESVLLYVNMMRRFGYQGFSFMDAYTVESTKYLMDNTTSRDVFLPVHGEKMSTYDASYLRGLQTFVAANPTRRFILYLPDESDCTSAANLANCVTIIQRVRKECPDCWPFVTSHFRKELSDAAQGKIIFAVVQNYVGTSTAGVPMPKQADYTAAGAEVWNYVSDMSSKEETAYGKGVPDFALDRDPVYVRAWATVALAQLPELKGLFYYQVMVQLPTTALTESIIPPDYMVNMDGIQVYADLTQHKAVPSQRMYEAAETLIDGSMIRELLSRPEHRDWMLARLKTIAPDQFTWSRSYSTYTTLRTDMVGRLKP
jgi:hypothetical protein